LNHLKKQGHYSTVSYDSKGLEGVKGYLTTVIEGDSSVSSEFAGVVVPKPLSAIEGTSSVVTSFEETVRRYRKVASTVENEFFDTRNEIV